MPAESVGVARSSLNLRLIAWKAFGLSEFDPYWVLRQVVQTPSLDERLMMSDHLHGVVVITSNSTRALHPGVLW